MKNANWYVVVANSDTVSNQGDIFVDMKKDINTSLSIGHCWNGLERHLFDVSKNTTAQLAEILDKPRVFPHTRYSPTCRSAADAYPRSSVLLRESEAMSRNILDKSGRVTRASGPIFPTASMARR